MAEIGGNSAFTEREMDSEPFQAEIQRLEAEVGGPRLSLGFDIQLSLGVDIPPGAHSDHQNPGIPWCCSSPAYPRRQWPFQTSSLESSQHWEPRLSARPGQSPPHLPQGGAG